MPDRPRKFAMGSGVDLGICLRIDRLILMTEDVGRVRILPDRYPSFLRILGKV